MTPCACKWPLKAKDAIGGDGRGMYCKHGNYIPQPSETHEFDPDEGKRGTWKELETAKGEELI